MTRAEFIAYLARAAADPDINLSEDEAHRLLRDFDAGRLDMASLPLPLDQAIQPTDDHTWEVAAGLVGVYLARRAMRVRGRNRLRQSFISTARTLAEAVATSGDVAVWQVSMRDLSRTHIAAQAMLGAGTNIRSQVGPLIDVEARRQGAYLSRFADAVTAAELTGKPMGVAHVGSRAAGYAGAPWSWFFKGQESVLGEDVLYAYITRDDDGVCDACQEAERGSPYPALSGPMPGDVCFGGGRCRCERVPVEGSRRRRR